MSLYIQGVEIPMWVAMIVALTFIMSFGKTLAGLTWKEYFGIKKVGGTK